MTGVDRQLPIALQKLAVATLMKSNTARDVEYELFQLRRPPVWPDRQFESGLHSVCTRSRVLVDVVDVDADSSLFLRLNIHQCTTVSRRRMVTPRGPV